jgi:hypothetical protein
MYSSVNSFNKIRGYVLSTVFCIDWLLGGKYAGLVPLSKDWLPHTRVQEQNEKKEEWKVELNGAS